MEIISIGRLEYKRWGYNMPSSRKFTVEFKVKAVELAKKLGRPAASLRVLDG